MKTSLKPLRHVFAALLAVWISGLGAGAQQTIYDDQLASGWGNYSWAANKLDCASPVHTGKHSISVTVAAGSYGALEFRSAPLDAAKFSALTFWIHGGPVGGQSTLVVKASVDTKQKGSVPIPALEPNAWKRITVPLSALGAADTTRLTGFLIQNNAASALPTFFVDDIQLTAGKSGSASSAAPSSPFIRKGPVSPLAYTGVNISGGEFDNPKPGARSRYGTNFIYPSDADFDYFASKGVNIVRLPFHWENIQNEAQQALNPEEIARLKSVVKTATEKGLVVLLDPHNFARYYGKVIGGPEVSSADFADFWGKLAAPFAGNNLVWFGLMNEPHDMPAGQWLEAANAAIAAIRKTGAKNRILVPGISWTGAHSWLSSGNAVTMLNIVDPQNNYIFEVHQYLDADSSGTKTQVVSATVGSERLKQFTLWCREHHQHGFLGEFGAPDSEIGAAASDDMFRFMEQNRDVWTGFSWWSAGAWFGDYMFTVSPKNGQDRPQMAYLRPHLQARPVLPHGSAVRPSQP